MSQKYRGGYNPPPQLSQAQLDLGVMPNAVWNPGKIRGNPLTYRASVQADSIWNVPKNPAFPSAHIVYANSWTSDFLVGQRFSSRTSPKSLIAPDIFSYSVDLFGSIKKEWGMDGNNPTGIEVSLYIQPKRGGGYWSKLSFPNDWWFMDGSRLCKPSFSNRYVANCGVGAHTIKIGYGNPAGMTNILWVTSTNLVMLPQNEILSTAGSSNFISKQLPSSMYGISGKWIVPTSTGISESTKKAITYRNSSNVSTQGIGWGIADMSLMSTQYKTPFDQIFVSENGNIIINKNQYYAIRTASIKRSVNAGFVPLRLVFKTNAGYNHYYNVWLQL